MTPRSVTPRAVTRREQSVRAPRLDPPELVDLRLSTGGELVSHAVVEGVRFVRLDLSDRDLTDASISECEFVGVSLSGESESAGESAHTTLRGVKLLDVRFDSLSASVVAARDSRWRAVEVDGSRIGSLELWDSELSAVSIRESKLTYANLRGSELTDVEIRGCRIEELDLGSARLSRVAVVDCQVDTILLSGARLDDVDLRGTEFTRIEGLDGLRGATVDHHQLAALAPLLAAQAGLRVE